MASEPQKDTTTEAALQAMEEALSLEELGIAEEPASGEEPGGADSGSPKALELDGDADFDPDFAELELKLTEAANDMRGGGTDFASGADPDFPAFADAMAQSDFGDEIKAPINPPAVSAAASSTSSGPQKERISRERVSSDRSTARSAETRPLTTLLPANENKRDEIADLVYAMQKQTSGQTYWVASFLSLGWLGLCAGLYWLGVNDGTIKTAALGNWGLLGLVAVAIIPVLLFWAFSMMIRRAQEMRLAARTMTEAAIRLLQPEDVAADSITTVGRAVRREVASIGDGIERALGRATELESLVQSEVRNLERSYTDSEIRLRGLVSELSSEREGIINHAEKLRDSLSFTHTGLTEELDQVAGRIQYSIDEGTIRMSEALRARHETIHATLEEAGHNLVSLLSSSGADLQNAVASATVQAKDSLSGKAQELGKQVNLIGQAVATLIETRTASIRETSENATREIEMTLGARAKEFTSRLDLIDSNIGTRSNALLGILTTQADQLANQLGRVDQTLVERHDSMQSLSERINEALDTRAVRIEETLRARTADLARAFNEGDQSVRNTIEHGLTGSAESARHITGLIEDRNLKLIGELDTRAQQISNTLNERTAELSRAFSEGDRSVRETIEFGVTNSAQASSRIAGLIDDRNRQLVGQIDNRVDSFTGAIDQRTAALLGGIEKRAAVITSALDERTGRMFRGVDDHTKGFIENLDKRAQLLTMAVEEKNRALAAVMSSQTQSIGDAIDQKAERLSRILSERATAINASLGTGLLETQRNIENRTGELSRVLSERMREFNDILDNQAKPVVEAITARGNDVTVRLGTLHQTVSTDLNQLLGSFSSSSEIMQKMLDTAGSRISSMQETLTTQTRDLTQAVDKANRDVNISAQVSASAQQKMDTTATGLVATISSIAERFEEQGLMLQHATRLIDAAQGNFSSTLEEKQESLHSLAAGLVERTQTIERTMASFGEMLRTTLDDVSEKSRGVGSIVATEIGSAIDQANMRFAKSVEVMRQAAADVQRDLEETREQMRRGVLELPDETRESAEAMRQVVSDQIAALRDLSSIVARSGKAIELPPSQRVSAIGAPGSFGRTNVRGAEASTASLPPLSARRPEVTESGRPFGQPASTREAAPARAPQPAVRNNRDEPRAPAGRGRETEAVAQGGWVSDLLRRASREEDEPPRRDLPRTAAPRQQAINPAGDPAGANRSPLHVVESLNSLSMDIARAIDHDAFIDLWGRYQRGERNVFTRRLYTLQGEQTFDEIRSKYGREQEFRSAVDRYISDFEKLLADVSRNDRDQMMTQTYLTSDTGKVYTMLAHAAGRFGA